jgi:hypothetical protein
MEVTRSNTGMNYACLVSRKPFYVCGFEFLKISEVDKPVKLPI